MTKDESSEYEFRSADDFRPLIQDRIYPAKCVGFNKSYFDKKRDKLFLKFDVYAGKTSEATELFMVFNVPKNKKIGSGSRYHQAWTKVHGKKPSKNAILTPRVFLNKTFRVRTRTVKHSFDSEKGRIPKHESQYYSIVEEIVDELDLSFEDICAI